MLDATAAHGVTWDLNDLYAGPGDPRIVADLDGALVAAHQFAQRYRQTIAITGGPAVGAAIEAVIALEAIMEQVGKACTYAELLHAADSAPAAHGALVASTQEKASAIRQQVLFFELEWLAVDDAHAQRILDDPRAARYRHFLESLRRYRPHVLSEPEERILEEKANTGPRAFTRLFDDLLSAVVFDVEVAGERHELNESGVLSLLHDNRREVRRNAAEALTRGLERNQLVLGFIFNTLVNDHAIDDRLRAFSDPMHSRHLANEIRSATVQALMQACEARHDVVRRYYRLKGKLLCIEPLADYDRTAPIAEHTTMVAWPRCREIVLGAYHAFAPRMSEIAAEFFDRRWIDAEIRSGKRGGAFSASTVPSVHPYILVNYTGRLNDVMTVAHELGHGVHQYLSRQQGYLQADTPLTTAETASVFGEMLVFEHLLCEVTDCPSRLALLCGKIEDTIGTVFRQITLTRFEEQLHQARRTQGELAREQICSIWQTVNAALYGDAVQLSDNYRWWWAYIPHFVHTPFYCYAYGFGELLVLALYEMYRREGAAFVPKYLELLSAGGSDTPERLLCRIGVDIADPGFWNLGLAPFERMVEEAERLAAA